MREWIEYISFMNRSVDKLCKKLEERIEEKALNLYLPAKKGIEEIERLSQIKYKLINLRVMHDALKRHLKADELAVLYGDKQDYDSHNRSALCRKRKSAVIRAESILKGLGFDKERLIKEYFHIKDGFAF